jgi:hypothetical protein
MAEKLDPKELVTFDELTLSNACELEALVEVLTAKGVITKRPVPIQFKPLAIHGQRLVESSAACSTS